MAKKKTELHNAGYKAWLEYPNIQSSAIRERYASWCYNILTSNQEHPVIKSAVQELTRGIQGMLNIDAIITQSQDIAEQACITIGTFDSHHPLLTHTFSEAERTEVGLEGYVIRTNVEKNCIGIGAATPVGLLYGVFAFLRLLGTGQSIEALDVLDHPVNTLRMMNQWDNIDGSIERGYAGKSIFYAGNEITKDFDRLQDYARMLASIGINAIAINNVNVHRFETMFITDRYLPDIARVADIFRNYGVKLFLSINYASPIELGGLNTADPLDPEVRQWWKAKAIEIYKEIPDFGGFLVKADSENRPGPFTYDRDHAEGSNMLAEALLPFEGIVIWRCFVYNCKQDWRDRSTDRARAAYDHFKPLDGRFMENVILQVKNGPMDFQVREGVSPLFGAMKHTNMMIEFQITQEYTGQQRHVCYLVPQWKEVLDFNTYATDSESSVKRVVDGSMYGNRYSGFAAVSNIGNDHNWTGHLLAQANLYGYGRLAWNPELSAEQIAKEWIMLTFGAEDEQLIDTIREILLTSWHIYESYTSPLGVGWMVNPDHHYGPNVDGYEYSKWGTYHFADLQGIGVDRTMKTGTGYVGQYQGANVDLYESVTTCPDELLLFFHHVPYTHTLHSGKTVIEHIYDSHFEGVEQADQLKEMWQSLEGKIDDSRHGQVADRLHEQALHAREWRDIINTYFYRKSGIPDRLQRKVY
ncbi:alpha-glucuronidase family glycosyl hydrolase [Paenibacillus sp. B-A-8]|uniref:alpha-glucuronidase family glycosyl hydrolase n=1 Tax=Paenibacillus sp. B-A-8 TaxID=3400419 RepID=UPI003B01F174